MPYNKDKTILGKNIETMIEFVNDIILVLNKDNNNTLYEEYANNFVRIIEIESGHGSGDAILQIFNQLKTVEEIFADIFLIWGDSIQDSTALYRTTLNNYNDYCTVPIRLENEPYTHFVCDHDNIIKSVEFKNRGAKYIQGYHDFSLFLFNLVKMNVILDSYNLMKWLPENNKYDTINGEFEFLDIFNQFNYLEFAKAVIIDNIKSNNAFNTMEEYLKLINGVTDENSKQ